MERQRNRLEGLEELEKIDWLEYEHRVALEAIEELSRAADLIAGRKNNKTVHDTRIAFRRWYSVWSILEQDGWDSRKFAGGPGKRLRRVYKTLGRVRDWDVNCKLGKSLRLPDKILDSWAGRRRRVRKKAFRRLGRLDLHDLVESLSAYIEQRYARLSRRRDRMREPAYDHIERMLGQHEKETRKLARRAGTIEELHAMRLCIKSWRYILVEFFGLTSVKLVQAQQILGKITDAERLTSVLTEALDGAGARRRALVEQSLAIVSQEEKKLIAELDSLKRALPYGLRPGHISQAGEN
ncbi:MAG: CHAD domain-containing protein [Candidatus Melainabacteria bacterium]|nr:CHAD domain-containing protein [Candidatus Melainabacteria bacterium]